MTPRHLLALAVTLCTLAGPAAAEWTLLGTQVDGTRVLIDRATIQTGKGGWPAAWFLFSYPKPQTLSLGKGKLKAGSDAQRIEVDCAGHSLRVAEAHTYAQRDKQGAVVHVYRAPADEPFDIVPSGTSGISILAELCPALQPDAYDNAVPIPTDSTPAAANTNWIPVGSDTAQTYELSIDPNTVTSSPHGYASGWFLVNYHSPQPISDADPSSKDTYQSRTLRMEARCSDLGTRTMQAHSYRARDEQDAIPAIDFQSPTTGFDATRPNSAAYAMATLLCGERPAPLPPDGDPIALPTGAAGDTPP